MTPFVQKLVERGCYTEAPDTDILTIAKLMHRHRIGTVVITTKSEIAGIISERDIIRAISKTGTISGLKASDLMTKNVKIVTPDVNSTNIMQIMSEANIRHLPIVKDNILLGIVSITDVVRRLSEKTQQEAEMLREFINS